MRNLPVNNTGYLKGAKTAKNPVNIIPSNLITTQGMAFPIKANGKTLYPNTGQYKFPTPYVVETPLKQKGSNEIKAGPVLKKAIKEHSKPKPTPKPVSKKQLEDDDSWLENAWEIVDPTGTSSYDDVYRSYKNTGLSGETALEAFGALPFIGKIGKSGKIISGGIGLLHKLAPQIKHLPKAMQAKAQKKLFDAYQNYSKNGGKNVDDFLGKTTEWFRDNIPYINPSSQKYIPAARHTFNYSQTGAKVKNAISNFLGSKDNSGFKYDPNAKDNTLKFNGRNIFPTMSSEYMYQDGAEELSLPDRASEAAKFTYRIKDKKRRDTQVADMYNNTLDSFRGDTTNAKRHFKSFFTDYGSERFDGVRPLEGYYGFDRKDYDDKTLDSLGRDWHKKMKVSKKDNGKYQKGTSKLKNPSFNKEYAKKLRDQYEAATRRGLSSEGLGDLALGLSGEALAGTAIKGAKYLLKPIVKGAKNLLKPVVNYGKDFYQASKASGRPKLPTYENLYRWDADEVSKELAKASKDIPAQQILTGRWFNRGIEQTPFYMVTRPSAGNLKSYRTSTLKAQKLENSLPATAKEISKHPGEVILSPEQVKKAKNIRFDKNPVVEKSMDPAYQKLDRQNSYVTDKVKLLEKLILPEVVKAVGHLEKPILGIPRKYFPFKEGTEDVKANLGPTIENAKKLKSKGGPQLFPTPTFNFNAPAAKKFSNTPAIDDFTREALYGEQGRQMAENSPNVRFAKQKERNEAYRNYVKKNPLKGKATGQVDMTMSPVDLAIGAGAGLVGGTIRGGAGLLSRAMGASIPGTGGALTVGQGLNAYGAYDAIANRAPAVVRDIKNKNYTGAVGEAALGGLGMYGLKGTGITDPKKLKDLGNFLTKETPLKNTYKLNPFSLKENPNVLLHRVQKPGQTEEYIMEQFNKPDPRELLKSNEPGWGRAFSSDPSDMYYYTNPRVMETRGYSGNPEILRTVMPKKDIAKFDIESYNASRSSEGLPLYGSSRPKSEFILPIEDVINAKKFGIDDLDKLVKESHKFNTPHWLKGFKKQGSKNIKPVLKYKNGSKSVSLAFSRGEKDPKGGLTQKGVDKYNRATGGNLKMAVTTPPSKLKPGSKAANRRKSFCARMSGVKGPMQKNGKPTRKALALRKWNC